MRHLHTTVDAPSDATTQPRATGALARLLGAGLAVTIGLATVGMAASPSFASTTTDPTVAPVACPAGMTCTGSSSGGQTTTTTTGHTPPAPHGHTPPPPPHRHTPPKPPHHHTPPKPPAPHGHANTASVVNVDGSGVKWH